MIAVLQEQSNSGDDHPAEHDARETCQRVSCRVNKLN